MLENEEVVEKKKISLGVATIITLLTIILLIVGLIFVMRMTGKNKLSMTVSGMELVDVGEKNDVLEEGQILYQDKKYEMNKDLITILVMGIDKETVKTVGGQSWEADGNSEYRGGQADALFLVLLNPHDKNIYVIAINRNTMTDVDVFDEAGNYKGVFVKQIALQHGYGDGEEESCERQVKAVSRMFHNIPISAYAAISMDAIPEINDAVGGITVEVLDDIVYPEYDMNLHKGETVTLHGEKAYWYVRLRNENVFKSNELRLQRQKQYLTTFATEAKKRATEDIRVAIDLYSVVQKYMVTDINIDSFTYLATEAVNYNFDLKNMFSLEGETIQGDKFEEFYSDEGAMEALIVQLFYEQVEGN